MAWWVSMILGAIGGFFGGVVSCVAFISNLAKREKAANRK